MSRGACLLLGRRSRNLRGARLPTRTVGFELLDQELQFPDIRIELLRGTNELQPAKLGDEELEMLDLVITLGESRLLVDDQTLERLDVIGQITSVEHIVSLLIHLA